MRLDHAGLVAVILAAGVAVALPAVLIIIALKGHASAADAELIGVVVTLAGTVTGTVCGWLAGQQDPPGRHAHVRQDDDGAASRPSEGRPPV